jgi:cytochrome c
MIATLGQIVFSDSCATCHGSNGQGGVGPALWGANAKLGTYAGTSLFAENAQAMLNFISANMPLNELDSLTSTQYLDVLCYIVLQDNQVSA